MIQTLRAFVFLYATLLAAAAAGYASVAVETPSVRHAVFAALGLSWAGVSLFLYRSR